MGKFSDLIDAYLQTKIALGLQQDGLDKEVAQRLREEHDCAKIELNDFFLENIAD